MDSNGAALRSGFLDEAPRITPCGLAAPAPHSGAAPALRPEGFTGHRLCASRQRLTATAASRLFLKRAKLAIKHKPAVNLLLFALFFLAVGLRAGQAAAPDRAAGNSLQKSPRATGGGGSATKIDVCALLTSAEIKAVQGEPIKEKTPSEQHGGSFLMSQCFFRTATFAKSVSLALATPDPSKPPTLTPREYWRKQFHPPEQEKGEEEKPAAGTAPKKAEPERERESRKPLVIDGLGEEAYWVGNSISGALYVLKGNSFLRISVGGVREESARMEKSKALAHAALKRL